MNELEKNTVTSLFWRLLERGGSQAVALIVQLVMARLLAPEEFGILAILLVFISIANVITNAGLSTSLIQAKSVDESDFSTVFWISFFVSLVLYLILFFSAPFIAEFYNSDSLVLSLRVLSLVIVLNSFTGVQIASLQRNLQFKKIFNASCIAVVVSGTIGVSLAFAGFELWALVMQQIASSVVNGFVIVFQTRWHPRFIFDTQKAKNHLSFGLYLLAASLLDVVYQGFSNLVIGKKFSASDLGVVSQGSKYPYELATMIDGAIQPVMLSTLSKVKDDLKTLKSYVRRALKTLSFATFPAMGLAGLIAEQLVLYIMGEQWLPAVPFFQLYCFMYAWRPVHTTCMQALNALGKSKSFFIMEVILKIFGVIVLLITAFALQNLYAIVIGYIVTDTILMVLNIIVYRRFVGYFLNEQIRDLLPAILLTLVALTVSSLLFFVPLSDLVRALLQCLIFIASYLMLAVVFRVESLSFLIGFMKNLFKKN